MYLRSPNLRLAGRTKVPVPQISFVFFLSSFLSLDSGSNSLLFASSILLVVLLSFFFWRAPSSSRAPAQRSRFRYWQPSSVQVQAAWEEALLVDVFLMGGSDIGTTESCAKVPVLEGTYVLLLLYETSFII